MFKKIDSKGQIHNVEVIDRIQPQGQKQRQDKGIKSQSRGLGKESG